VVAPSASRFNAISPDLNFKKHELCQKALRQCYPERSAHRDVAIFKIVIGVVHHTGAMTSVIGIAISNE
jgi:hypothetical protein